MKRLQKLYNAKYSVISVYALKTAMMIFVAGMIVYYLAGRTGSALSFISAVLKPLVLGLVFTYLLSPLVGKLEEKPFGALDKPASRRVAAVALTFGIVLAAIVLIIGIIIFTVTRSITSVNLEGIKDYLVVLSEQFSKFWTTIEKQLASMNISLGSVGDMFGSIFNGVKSGASTLLFAVIFTIYFLLDEKIKEYWGDVLDALLSDAARIRLRTLAGDADRVFSGYIRGQSLDALMIGVLVSVALLIARVPYAVVIGILTGIGNLVPYVGPIVGFGSLIIVCLAEGSLMTLIIGAVILAVVMFIDGNIINPRMLSSNVEVHPVLVIVALLAGGKVGGLVGMLVAVPVAALLKLQFDKYVDRKRRTSAEAEAGAEAEA